MEPMVQEDIIDQHMENAIFLFSQREHAIEAPHFRLEDVYDLENSLAANLDGLSHASAKGWELPVPTAPPSLEPGTIFVAAVLAFQNWDSEQINQLLQLVEKCPELRSGLFGAVGWLWPEALRGQVYPLLDDKRPLARLLGVAACSLHRVYPNERIKALLHDGDPEVRARTYRLAGELGADWLKHDLRQGFSNGNANQECCFWSAWSAALLGDQAGLAVLVELVSATSKPHVRQAGLEVLTRTLAPPAIRDLMNDLYQQSVTRRSAIRALGMYGDVVTIPWLIERMGDPYLARSAGASFALMTGAELAFDDLELDLFPDSPFLPNDEPGDERVAVDPDEDEPWPDPGRVARWWQDHRARFETGRRYLLGQLAESHRELPGPVARFQSQFRAVAYEIALRAPRSPLARWHGRIAFVDGTFNRRWY